MILFQLKSSYQSHCVVSKMCHFVMSEKVGPKYEEVPAGNAGFERGTRNAGFLFLVPYLGSTLFSPGGTFDIPGKCLTRRWSLGLSEDCSMVFRHFVAIFGWWFSLGDAGPTPGWRGKISLGLVDHSIERESLVLLPGGFVLVGVCLVKHLRHSRQIR